MVDLFLQNRFGTSGDVFAFCKQLAVETGMNAQNVEVFRILMRGPSDAFGLTELIERGAFQASDVVAILGKTEGNGGVNDFTREYATSALSAALAPHLAATPREVEERIAFVMSGGTEGVLSPHITMFTRRRIETPAPGPKRLAIGVAATRMFRPEEIGRLAQVEETARAVESAMRDAQIESAGDVHFVQIKCPLLTADRVEDALARGQTVVTKNSYASMAFSRAASALGIGIALGEIEPSAVTDEKIGKDWSLSSNVASTSAGIELLKNVVILFGNSAASRSRYQIGHSVMKDAIDLQGVLDAFGSAGVNLLPAGKQAGREFHVFAKAEAAPSGLVRGLRHTMLEHTDISATRHARAAVGGVIAGVAGHGAIYVSGGAEHQGPPGGGPIAVIAEQEGLG